MLILELLEGLLVGLDVLAPIVESFVILVGQWNGVRNDRLIGTTLTGQVGLEVGLGG